VWQSYIEPKLLFHPQPRELIPDALNNQNLLFHRNSVEATHNYQIPHNRLVIVFYGNAGSAFHIANFVDSIFESYTIDESIDVIVFEYSGFGYRHAERVLLRDSFMRDAQFFAYTHDIQDRYKTIDVIGISMGAAVASYVVANAPDMWLKRVNSVILVTPFSSIATAVDSVINHYVSWACSWNDVLDNKANLEKLMARNDRVQRIVVFAEDDELLPVRVHAPILLPVTTQQFVLRRAKHNDVCNVKYSADWLNWLRVKFHK
jgi:predicted alpha/beta-fold hydrolase